MRIKRAAMCLGILASLACAGAAFATTITITSGSTTQFNVNGSAGGPVIIGSDLTQSTGTGVIDPFLREQANGSGGVEEGMNTSLVNNYLDNKMPVDGFTRDLPLSVLSTSTVGGKQYYNFFLDVNQNASHNNPNAYISLTEVRIYISSQAATAAQLDALRGTPGNVFDMDDALAYDIQIPSNNGSGNGDLTMLVPVSSILPAGAYVYLYAKFGGLGSTFEPNDGFEEWRALTGGLPPPGVPDYASTVMLLGMGLVGIAGVRRKLRG
jgi:hypothetical protein